MISCESFHGFNNYKDRQQIASDVFERAQVTLQYDIWPWARVIQTGLKEKNFMIGGLGRTPKREKGLS